jgi:transposase
VVEHVKAGTKIYTEDWRGFEHESVNYSAKEYVRGDVHTNAIEAF